MTETSHASLSTMRLAELQKLAASMGLKGTSRLRKSELIAAIRDGGASPRAGDSGRGGEAARTAEPSRGGEAARTDETPARAPRGTERPRASRDAAGAASRDARG
ncbi:Rho termination factor N-terminal domain-containing protein, partial [Actinomyces sp. AC-19-1]|uniref:Rho termination factor N-terminal domain-containing protein n=1 Tax=Actinomyces sp. 217892 TaxID=2927827 RepID=UPI00201795F5|nr:Rho termination factor N-terminal domain-containing protein [Actinomyces sp. 217892]